MSAETTWNKIITQIKQAPLEIATAPTSNREPLWFYIYMENGNIYIDNAILKKPSTKMTMRRKISEKDFTTVYPYYQLRIQGDSYKAGEAVRFSKNTAYIYALIAHFEKP